MSRARWTAMLAGGMTALLILALAGSRGPAPDRNDPFDSPGILQHPLEMARRRISRGYFELILANQQATEQWVALRVRDSIATRLSSASSPSNEPLSVLANAGVAQFYVNLVRARLDSQRRAMPRVAPGLRALVIAVVDDSSTLEGVNRQFVWGRGNRYLLPPVTDGQTCVVTHRAIGLGLSRRLRDTSVALRSVRRDWENTGVAPELGPCAFVLAFGMPGPGIGAWLDSVGWQPARLSKPELAAPALLRSRVVAQRQQRLGLSASEWVRDEEMIFSGAQREYAGLAACALDNRAMCADFVTLREGTRPASEPVAGVIAFQRGMQQFQLDGPPLSLPHPRLLANVLTEIGPDRFAAFWRSSKPFDTALREATGLTVGEWSVRYVRDQYGASVAPTPRWPRPALAGAAIFIVLAFGATARGFTRR